MHNSIKINFEGIALEDGGTIVKDIPYVVGLKNYHFILSNLSLGGVIQNDISVEAVVTLESVIENEGQEDEFTSYHQQIVFKNVYGYDVTIYDKTVTASLVMTPQDVLDAIAGGTLENAKPIYFHPVVVYKSGEYNLILCVINNSETEFTRSTLISYIKSIPNARFIVNGSFINDTEYVVSCYTRTYNNVIYLIGLGATGDQHSETINTINFETLVTNSVSFYDGVNKIN